VVFALHLSVAVTSATLSTKGVFLPGIVAGFHTTRAVGSSLLSGNLIAGACISLGVGAAFAMRVSFRTLVLVPTLVVGAGVLLAAFSTNFATLFSAYLIMGTASVIAFVAVPVLVTTYFDKNRSLAIGLILAGTSTGGAALTPLLASVVAARGWRAGYLPLAALLLIVLPPLIWWSLPPNRLLNSSTDGRKGISLTKALRHPALWALLFVSLSASAVINAYFVHFIPILEGDGYSASRAAAVMSLTFIGGAITKILFGYIADWIGPHRALGYSSAFTACGLILLTMARYQPAMYAFVAIFGLSYAAPLVLLPMSIAQSFGLRSLAVINSAMAVPTAVVGAAGSVLAGWVFDHQGNYQLALMCSAALMGVSTAFLMLTAPRMPVEATTRPMS
jgi:predicted MFS family arabinose efflux permease